MAEEEIGTITHYFAKPEVGIVKVTKGKLEVGDTLHIVGAHDDFTMTVESMELDHATVESAKKGAEVGIKVPQRVHEHDKVFRVT